MGASNSKKGGTFMVTAFSEVLVTVLMGLEEEGIKSGLTEAVGSGAEAAAGAMLEALGTVIVLWGGHSAEEGMP